MIPAALIIRYQASACGLAECCGYALSRSAPQRACFAVNLPVNLSFVNRRRQSLQYSRFGGYHSGYLAFGYHLAKLKSQLYIRDNPVCTGPENLIRSIATIVCNASHDARLPSRAIQIRIKQYKFNKHFLGCPKQAFQRQTIASAILQPAVALKFPKHSKIYDHQRPTSKEMMDEEIN